MSWRRRLFDPLAWRLSRRELGRLREAAGDDPAAVVDAGNAYVGRGFYASIRAVQERAEILPLAEELRRRAPPVVVEIGTYKGGTLWIWCRVARPRLAISIDLPGGQYGGGFDRRREKLYREFLADRAGAEMLFVRGDSQAPATVEQVRGLLAGRPIDFLYLDGDHRYAGVRADFEGYAPLVRPGGLIALHDIVTRTADCEVWRLWRELEEAHPGRTETLVAPGSNKGLGLLRMP